MLTEEDVIESVCDYLEEKGYNIGQRLGTTEQGYDIIAQKTTSTGTVFMYVEAKGATSSKNTSSRFGQIFNSSQVRTHVSVALYKACETLSVRTGRNSMVQSGIALPNDTNHKYAVNKIRASLEKLGIYLFFVNDDHSIECFPNLNQ